MSKITKNERINALEQQVKGLIEDYKLLSRHVDCTSENLVSSPLIERESKELTGSDLCRAMLARGDKFVMCLFSDGSDEHAIADRTADACINHDDDWFATCGISWVYAVPINNQGEPLTAAEVGL